MCFSPQRRAIFRHLNFKKWSKHAVFCTFSLPDVLFATTACNFSTSELQKVLRDCGVLYIFTSKSAFRHSGVQFLISLLSTDLRTRRFNRLTFRLTRQTNHWKNTAFRDFSNIWRGCIFFLLTFALLHLLSADLTTLLCFSTVHIVGSFYLNFLRLSVSFFRLKKITRNLGKHRLNWTTFFQRNWPKIVLLVAKIAAKIKLFFGGDFAHFFEFSAETTWLFWSGAFWALEMHPNNPHLWYTSGAPLEELSGCLQCENVCGYACSSQLSPNKPGKQMLELEPATFTFILEQLPPPLHFILFS